MSVLLSLKANNESCGNNSSILTALGPGGLNGTKLKAGHVLIGGVYRGQACFSSAVTSLACLIDLSFKVKISVDP
jgi:hypothetical protein